MISKYLSRINSVWQMQKIKIARYLLISLVFISSFFISSCAWFGGNDLPVFPTATIRGAIRIEGAVPSEILTMMNTSSERTVVPSALGSGTVSYTCEVKDSDDNTIPASSYTFNTESDDSGNVYYTIAGLPLTTSPQTLKLTITLKVGTNEVLRSTEQELEGLSLTQPSFQKNIVLRPISEGSGSYSLIVNLDSSINISTETYKLCYYLYDPADPTNTSKIKNEYKQLTSDSWGWSGSMPSGTYKAIISLYKVVGDTEYLMYQFEEIVNIFQNLQTNTWLKHSDAQEYIDDSVTPAICKITAECISNFLTTNIYVDSSTTVDAASQTGSYLAPFSDIRNAFYYIRNISTSDSTTTYTIQVKGGSSFTFSSGIAVNRNIVIKCWATTPGDNLGSATILADSSSFTGSVIFNISDGKKFTAHHGLIIDGNNKSVVGVQVSEGIFEMCGGGNKIRNCNIGLALSEKTSTNTVAANLTSGMITSNKTGVSVTSSNTLNVSGVITIDGNVNTSSQKNNVYLPDGITFNVNGELTNGANICVSTATAATLETKVSIVAGYSDYHATATNPPSAYIHSDLGDPIIYNATTSTVQIAKNGGSIKNSYDVKFSFAASSTLMKPDTAKAITIIPTITTLNASGTPIPLYYNPADQKLYLEETFENLYLPDIAATPDYNKVTWNAALYNSGVLITGYQPTVETDDPANKFTLPALPVEKYTLLITATYLGIKHDAGFGITVKKVWSPTNTPIVLPAGTDGSAGTSGTYVLFGDWPQTVKAADVTIDESIVYDDSDYSGFTYYMGSDEAWYAKCEENHYSTSPTTYSDGQAIGSSEQYFKVEPIKWRVLDESFDNDDDSATPGKWFLHAENTLHSNIKYYGSTAVRVLGSNNINANSYEYSNVRAWLNGINNQFVTDGGEADSYTIDHTGNGFLQKAFTGTAQSKIAITKVDNSAASTQDEGLNIAQATTGVSTHKTEDKVFLLSEKEATRTAYGWGNYQSETKRVRKATDWALANYAHQSTSEGQGSELWLRSPAGSSGAGLRYVSVNGSTSNTYQVIQPLSVVPAICIDVP